MKETKQKNKFKKKLSIAINIAHFIDFSSWKGTKKKAEQQSKRVLKIIMKKDIGCENIGRNILFVARNAKFLSCLGNVKRKTKKKPKRRS